MLKRPFWLAGLLLALAAGCSSDDDNGGGDTPSKLGRTVLVYMAAQNSLGSSGNQKSDSTEIMKGRQYVGSNDCLLLFIDDAANPRIYRVTATSATPTLVKAWSEDGNSTSPDFLCEVLTWVKDSFPSDEYGLVMWSHADGWLPSTNKNYASSSAAAAKMRPYSFGIDDGSRMGTDTGTQMDVDDMATAIAESGMHPKYIFFDACLMQNLEVVYDLKDVTDYVVASPIATPAAGANYTHQLQSGLFAEDPSDIAATYASDVSDSGQAADYSDFGIVISAVRTDKVQAVADALSQALPYSTLVGKQSPDMTGVLKYQAYSYYFYYRPHNYDAAESIRQILPEEYQADVLAALDEAVVYKAATSQFWIGPGYWTFEEVDTDTYSGISLFVPQQVYTDNASICEHGDHNANFQNTAWYEAAGWAQTGW